MATGRNQGKWKKRITELTPSEKSIMETFARTMVTNLKQSNSVLYGLMRPQGHQTTLVVGCCGRCDDGSTSGAGAILIDVDGWEFLRAQVDSVIGQMRREASGDGGVH